MILCEENCDFLKAIAEKMCTKDIELIFVDNETMKEINFTQRNINKTTDVLSFPLENIHKNLPLGSIVINKDLAAQTAQEFKHSLEDEISLLFIHALLHLLGFDHETDQGQMREKEKELVEFFNLPTSLIVRTV